MNRLQDRVAIVTGGANGIGKVTAQRFAAEGARVMIWDLDRERGEATAAEITAGGGEAVFKAVNTSQFEEVEKGARDVADRWGRIDILINNAGITRDASLKKMTTEQWQQVMDVNLTGVFNCTKVVSQIIWWSRAMGASSVPLR